MSARSVSLWYIGEKKNSQNVFSDEMAMNN